MVVADKGIDSAYFHQAETLVLLEPADTCSVDSIVVEEDSLAWPENWPNASPVAAEPCLIKIVLTLTYTRTHTLTTTPCLCNSGSINLGMKRR